ncbi:MAG: dihydroorotate dehydrogenase electron transfer subunit [Candidatus Methylomirabilales bacterium]
MIRQKCDVLANRKSGPYQTIRIAASEIAEAAKPGQFIQVAIEPGHEQLLRRPFSIAHASSEGPLGGMIEFAVYAKGGGTEWLAGIQELRTLDVLGPLGTAFPYPRELTSCLLVGGGYGAAPLYYLTDELRERKKRVTMILGARSADRLYEPVEARRRAESVTVTTEDGSDGIQGLVTDVMPGVIEECGAEVVYACGPNVMLRAISEYCLREGIPCQVSIEELMACGFGVCWSCVVPVIRKGERDWDNLRTCVEGPVFNGAQIWWDRWLGPSEDVVLEAEEEEAAVHQVQAAPGES